MATKKSTTKSTKSRVASSAKKKSFISKPLAIVLGVVLILAVAVAGIVIYLNHSFAANWNGIAYDQNVNNVYWARLNNGSQGRCIDTPQSGRWCTGPTYKYSSGLAQWTRWNPNGTATCATIWPNNVSGKELTNYAYLTAGTVYRNGQTIRISETNTCDTLG